MFRCEEGRRYRGRVLSPIVRRLLLGGDNPVRQSILAFKGRFRFILPVVSSNKRFSQCCGFGKRTLPVYTWFGPDAAPFAVERYQVAGEQRVLCF